jgi:pyrrolysine biosynthesis protein PylD
MTRLKHADVQRIPRALGKYEEELIGKTGCTLLEIAEDAAQASVNMRRIRRKTEAAVVPITSGGGVIEGFSQAVAAILNHIGIRTTITLGVDVTGVAEAHQHGAGLMLLADDRRFVAINLHTGHVVDNAASTAKAYVAALDRMAKGLGGKPVLVIGAGNVGSVAVSELIRRKARPLAVDLDRLKLRALIEKHRRQVIVFNTVDEAMRHTNLIINAAPARNILKADMIKENTMISAPAIPIGLTHAALKKVEHNLVHDPLQLGVATMAVEACAK